MVWCVYRQVHPGYSMFDWTKICNSGRDLTGTNGKLLRVTPEELARHCTGDDLWTSVRGKYTLEPCIHTLWGPPRPVFFCCLVGVIYNCTLFAKYHPGGKPQLMRGAGKDCTELFDKVSYLTCYISSSHDASLCSLRFMCG